MKLKAFILSVLFFAAAQMIFAQNKQEFSLYLLPRNIKSNELFKLDIKKLKPKGKPFFKTEDICSYSKDTHEITLNSKAGKRLKKLKVPDGGQPFIVFVSNEPIYTGAFWRGFSSSTFLGVAIDVSKLEGDSPAIKLELDYPPLAPKHVAFDPRPDERIFQALKKAQKLNQ